MALQQYNIIGITGKKLSGKDTIADYLCNNYKYKKISFADPLKDINRILFDLSYEQLYGNLKEEPDSRWFNIKPREFNQFVGTNLFRDHMKELNEKFENNFWVIHMKNRIEKLKKKDPNILIVIPDIRFQNEYDLIKEMKGLIIEVERPNLIRNDKHISEMFKCTPDIILINDETKEELYKKIVNKLINF